MEGAPLFLLFEDWEALGSRFVVEGFAITGSSEIKIPDPGRFLWSFCRALPMGTTCIGWKIIVQPCLFVLFYVLRKPTGIKIENIR